MKLNDSLFQQRLASSSTGHHALLLQPYFVQQMICQISLALLLNMPNHGVMDFKKYEQYDPTCFCVFLCFHKTIFQLWMEYPLFLQDNIMSCHELIRQIGSKNKPKKQPKVLPQLRVMTRASITLSDSSSSSSSSSSYKRRKLNNDSWADDDKEKLWLSGGQKAKKTITRKEKRKKEKCGPKFV